MSTLFKTPSIPAPQALQAPPEPDFSYEDEARNKQAAEDERRRAVNRTGRRSTILTGSGLTDIEDENLEKKTLLGG